MQTLLGIVTDFERYAGVDLYRFEIPQDMSGQNPFRATLARLHSYQEANPGQDEDLAGFVRGEAWMRLGEFGKARQAFCLVADDAASSLSAQAARRRDASLEFEAALLGPKTQENDLRSEKDGATDLSPSAPIQNELDGFEKRILRLMDLEKRWGDAYESCLARREREKTEVEYTLFLFRNSCAIAGGKPRALELGERMIRDHAASRLVHAHRLRLGGFYLQLARDMADLTPPDRMDRSLEAGGWGEDGKEGASQDNALQPTAYSLQPHFDAEVFDHLISAAQQQFLLVSRADGYEEKLEGAALLREAEAFRRKVRKMAQ